MSLTKCMVNYWGMDKNAPFPCTLQLVECLPFGFRYGALKWQVHLNDGECIYSNFIYRPQQDNLVPLPVRNSVIKIYSNRSHKFVGKTFHIFDKYEIVAENTGRISRIGNPWYHPNDTYAAQEFD